MIQVRIQDISIFDVLILTIQQDILKIFYAYNLSDSFSVTVASICSWSESRANNEIITYVASRQKRFFVAKFIARSANQMSRRDNVRQRNGSCKPLILILRKLSQVFTGSFFVDGAIVTIQESGQ